MFAVWRALSGNKGISEITASLVAVTATAMGHEPRPTLGTIGQSAVRLLLSRLGQYVPLDDLPPQSLFLVARLIERERAVLLLPD